MTFQGHDDGSACVAACATWEGTLFRYTCIPLDPCSSHGPRPKVRTARDSSLSYLIERHGLLLHALDRTYISSGQTAACARGNCSRPTMGLAPLVWPLVLLFGR